MLTRTNNFVQSVTLLKSIWEVLGSNVGEIPTFLACFWCEILRSHSGELISKNQKMFTTFGCRTCHKSAYEDSV